MAILLLISRKFFIQFFINWILSPYIIIHLLVIFFFYDLSTFLILIYIFIKILSYDCTHPISIAVNFELNQLCRNVPIMSCSILDQPFSLGAIFFTDNNQGISFYYWQFKLSITSKIALGLSYPSIFISWFDFVFPAELLVNSFPFLLSFFSPLFLPVPFFFHLLSSF